MPTNKFLFERRRQRTRSRVKQRGQGRPRLSVFRSNKHIHAQVIDDWQGHTLAAASSIDRQLKGELNKGSDTAAAERVGKLVGERARQAGIEQVVFDRGGYQYHGRVKALADGARDAGLDF